MSTLKQKSTAILQEKENKIIPENIKSGVQIFDITGTLETGIDTSDATATIDDLAYGKTAYVKGAKITGTLEEGNYYGGAFGKGISVQGNNTIGVYGGSGVKQIVGENNTANINLSFNEVSEAIGLTANKIKKDETILDVTGTYEGSGIDTSDANAVASDIIENKTAYVKGSKVTGTLAEIYDISNSAIYVNESFGDLLFETNPNLSGESKAVITTSTRMAIGASTQVVAESIGLTANKIKKDETILGITGTYEGSGIDTSDATAAANDIVSGKTAYVKGSKVTGTISDMSNKSSGITWNTSGRDSMAYNSQQNTLQMTLYGVADGFRILISNTNFTVTNITGNTLASSIGLTADKIKKGVTILGITGTYEGDTPSYENLDEEVF